MNLREKFQYCAFYCEENIWKLCQEPEFKGKTAFVAFISNPQRSCAIWHQKAAKSATVPVVFDYHVILLTKDEEQDWLVWDLDTTLDFPVKAETYFHDSFSVGPLVPEEYQPLFRLLSPQDYILNLSTDRSHMKDKESDYLQPAPDWESPFQPEKGMNIFRFVQMEEDFIGEVMDLQMVRERFA